MFIKKIVSINNYRNLTDIAFEFDKEINFIVGENNIGKTNLIKMLNSLINIGRFNEDDFDNITEPIKVIFQIEYDEDELGFFENTFDIEDEFSITITAYQENVDTRIEYWHSESETYINPKTIKMLNYLYYSSLRSPNRELNFIKNMGTGKVLNYIMKRILESKDLTDIDLINKDDIDEIIDEVNNKFTKLNALSGEKINTFLSDDKQNIINRLLEIGGTNGRSLSCLGDGLQYSFNIFLNILELLVHLKTSKKEEDYENVLFKDEEGQKYLPIIVALDEPEIHQHPYRQRALIKSIYRIINNENQDFLEIIKELFDIDGFIGQVFVVTHSPSILLDDYKQIVRLFYKGDAVDATSGISLDFDIGTHKHLKRSFMYFKEAMFSKKIILVEGDTEFGAIPVFAEKLDCDLDKQGIGIVKLDGADSVLKYLQLFEAFDIDAIVILDKDKEVIYADNPNIYFTDKIDFEEEMFDTFSYRQYLKYLESINKHSFLIKYLKDRIHKFNTKKFSEKPLSYSIPEEVEEEIMVVIRDKEIEKLRNIKNVINGALLAKYVDSVPKPFKDIINRVAL